MVTELVFIHILIILPSCLNPPLVSRATSGNQYITCHKIDQQLHGNIQQEDGIHLSYIIEGRKAETLIGQDILIIVEVRQEIICCYKGISTLLAL